MVTSINIKEHEYKIYLLPNTSLMFHEFRVNIPALKFYDGDINKLIEDMRRNGIYV